MLRNVPNFLVTVLRAWHFREDFYFIFSANNKYKANKKLRWNVVTNDVK